MTFRKGDVTDLRRQLEYMLTHPEKVKEYAEQSTDFICGKYNWDEVVDKTIERYRRCCNKR